MSLQSVLIVIGLILVFVIYLISVWLEKKSNTSKSAALSQNNANKDEPSLVSLDQYDEDSDDIPILDVFAVDVPVDSDDTDSQEDDMGASSNREESLLDVESLQQVIVEDEVANQMGEQPAYQIPPDHENETKNTDHEFEDSQESNSRTRAVEEIDNEVSIDTDRIDETNHNWTLTELPEMEEESVRSPIDTNISDETDIIDWGDLVHNHPDSHKDVQDVDIPTPNSSLMDSNQNKQQQIVEPEILLQENIPLTTNKETEGNNLVQSDIRLGDHQDDETEMLEIPRYQDETINHVDDQNQSHADPVEEPDSESLIGSSQAQIEKIDHEPEIIDIPKDSSSTFDYPTISGFEKISQIDYWVKVYGERDVGRESVLAQFREAKAGMTKPSHVHGLKIPEKSWCNLEQEHEDARFGDLIVTIQLADSRGPIDEAELTQFSNLISKLSEGTGRSFTFMAPIESALKQGQALSEFIRYYESIFVVNIKPQHSDKFDGNAIHRCATQLGLERSANNYYVRNKSVGKEKVCLYSLANMSDTGQFDFENLKDLSTRGVTFFTKPAVNRSPGAVFAEMVDTAKAFAGRIKGEVIAPNYEDLSQDDVEQIRQSIEKVAKEMEDQGLTPGSDEAMRVF